MTPLISFIIPAYNIPEPLLRRSVDSIRTLSLSTHERQIIIVDDGSDSPVSNLWADDPTVVLMRQANAGLSAARNAALAIASATYVQLLDADDQLIGTYYDRCISILRQEQPDILKFDYTGDPSPAKQAIHYKTYESGAHFMIHNNLQPGACAYIFRRSTADGLTFTEGIYHEDEEFTPLLFLRAGKTIITNAPAYFYDSRPGSITQYVDPDKLRKRLADFYGVILRLKNHLLTLKKENGKSLSVRALQRRIDQAAMDYIINVLRLNRQAYPNLTPLARYKHLHQALNTAITQMQADQLFPLPPASYTSNYSRFRRIANSSLLRKILCIKKL